MSPTLTVRAKRTCVAIPVTTKNRRLLNIRFGGPGIPCVVKGDDGALEFRNPWETKDIWDADHPWEFKGRIPLDAGLILVADDGFIRLFQEAEFGKHYEEVKENQ